MIYANTLLESFMYEGLPVSFRENDGRIRNGVSGLCPVCKTVFFSRVDQPKKFCSVVCATEARKAKVSITCETCKKAFERQPSKLEGSKSGLYFCSRKCKEEAQKLGGLKEIQPSHYGTANNYRELFEEHELVCSRCGYKEFSCSIDIHHKDGCHENNDRANLEPLCRNCHQAYHNGCWS